MKITSATHEHEETAPEFHQRVQKQMDRESWIGRDDIGAEFPERAIVHEMEPSDSREHVYNWGKK